jgi:hypothetical protein
VKHLSKHISFANAVACIALFVALGGAAYAAKTTLGRKAVKTRNLANGAVTTLKLRGGAVTGVKLRNGAVTGAKIAKGTIGSGQLANGAVRSAQLGGGVVTTAKLKNTAVNAEKIAGNAVGSNQLAPNSVVAAKIQDGAVGSTKLASSLLASLVKGVSYVSKASPGNFSEKAKSVTAECPSAKQAIGGGGSVTGGAGRVAIVESAPALSGERRIGWTAAADDILQTESTNWAVEAFAICAEF